MRRPERGREPRGQPVASRVRGPVRPSRRRPAASPYPSAPTADAPPTHPGRRTNTPEFQQQIDALDCTDPVNFTGGRPDDPALWLGTCENTGAAKYNLEPAFIQGTNVTGANAVLPQSGVGWVVSLEFDSEGAKALADASTS